MFLQAAVGVCVFCVRVCMSWKPAQSGHEGECEGDRPGKDYYVPTYIQKDTTGGVRDWRSGILARWVGPWGDTCRDFSRYSPGPACLLPGRHGGMAAWQACQCLKC